MLLIMYDVIKVEFSPCNSDVRRVTERDDEVQSAKCSTDDIRAETD